MVTVEERYEHLEKTIRGYNISADLGQIRAAFDYAQEHHGTQMRREWLPLYHPPPSGGSDRGGNEAGQRVHYRRPPPRLH